MHQDTIDVADDRIDGPHGPVPIRRYRPLDRSAGTGSPTLVWVHGGGFFRGDLDLPESDAVARTLAEQGLPVVTVDYRLGPLPGLPWLGRGGPRGRRRAPHARDEVVGVLHHLRDESPSGLVLGGASAGACLAASAVATAPPLIGLVLAYVVDAERDVMRTSGERFATELEDAGVEVERQVLPDSRHAFLNRPGTRDFDDAIERITGWVDRATIH
ncbi:alpha/beta hydrolase [Curtobacterium aurantiacum]|uniref:alpha/beta hydrolase n=1 Tax=Curtobacterium aurantiacum TaxID=3236919 RepID=UPI0020327DFF|nr:alpha/beta hydrolase [Curtobacterium flaccumfaciens]